MTSANPKAAVGKTAAEIATAGQGVNNEIALLGDIITGTYTPKPEKAAAPADPEQARNEAKLQALQAPDQGERVVASRSEAGERHGASMPGIPGSEVCSFPVLLI